MNKSLLSKSDRAELTKAKLITIARKFFTKYGYSHTASEDIVKAAQVTRGALYHHFNGKEGLFISVIEKMQEEIGHTIEQEVRKTNDPFDQLVAGCKTFLQACSKPDVQQIMLIDGPAVIGWLRWREMDEKNSMSLLRENLTELIEKEIIKPYPVEALTHLLSGAMNEAVLWSATQKHPDISLAESAAALEEMLLSLKVENWQEPE